MTKDKIYVVEHAHPNKHYHVHSDLHAARLFQDEVPGGVVRVFTEDVPWTPAAEPPSDGRVVLARYRRHSTIYTITALFGSESKWIALDHDSRRTYLDGGTVLSWRDLPAPPRHLEPELPDGWVLTSARKPAPVPARPISCPWCRWAFGRNERRGS